MAGSVVALDARSGVGHAPRPAVLWAIAFTGVGAGSCAVYLALTNDEIPEPGVRAGLLVWVSLPYVLAGLVAWWRRPDSRLGTLMIAGGFAIFLSSLQWARTGFPYTVGQLFDVVPAAIFLHIYLAFPTGRLRGRFERALVVAAYAVAIGLQPVKMMLGGAGPYNLIEVSAQPDAAQTIERVQLVAMSAICLAGIGVLVARRHHEGRPLRRSLRLLVNTFALGLVMIAALFLTGAFQWPEFETWRRATFLVIGLSPIAFLLGLLDARLARSGVGDLIIELRADLTPANLRAAVARALRDPSLTLAYWLPEFETWADLDGTPVSLPNDEETRSATLIDRNGAPVAALIHDRALDEEPELLQAVGAAASIALENARLQAELAARLEEVRGSRARVIEAGQKERQRLERNLHDGAQQRLVALSLELSLLEQQLVEQPEAITRLDDARREIARSLDELRDVARGIHPAVLTGHGLEVALEQLAVRGPVPVQLAVDIQGRLAEPVEVAVYYVVSESLANIGKHARATSARVEISRAEGNVVVEVVDDGIGGADTERGSGLRGLADRVESLEGRLRVWSPVGGGTRLRAEIPCAS
jgi:signal transduction histidine kinase